MYNTQRRVGGAHTLWQHMEWWCPTNALTPRCWKLSCVFFLLVRSMSLVVVWFVVSEPFYFSFFFFSSPDNYNLTFFFIGMLTSVFILLIYNFLSLFFFCRILFVFSIIIQSQFTKYYILQFDPYYFDFDFFPLPF